MNPGAGARLLTIGLSGRAATTAGARNLVISGSKQAGRPGYELGTATASGFSRLANAFVGEGGTLSRSERALVSADKTFVARFPAAKTYGGEYSRIIGNLEVKNAAGQRVINAHVPIRVGSGF